MDSGVNPELLYDDIVCFPGPEDGDVPWTMYDGHLIITQDKAYLIDVDHLGYLAFNLYTPEITKELLLERINNVNRIFALGFEQGVREGRNQKAGEFRKLLEMEP